MASWLRITILGFHCEYDFLVKPRNVKAAQLVTLENHLNSLLYKNWVSLVIHTAESEDLKNWMTSEIDRYLLTFSRFRWVLAPLILLKTGPLVLESCWQYFLLQLLGDKTVEFESCSDTVRQMCIFCSFSFLFFFFAQPQNVSVCGGCC